LTQQTMTSATPTWRDRSPACAVAAMLLAFALPLALQAQSPVTPTPAQKSEQKPERMAKPETRIDGINDKTAAARSVAAKRQKLHECGIKWQDEKKAKGLTGKAAYLKFLSACMKS
jgi:hypothetical protein